MSLSSLRRRLRQLQERAATERAQTAPPVDPEAAASAARAEAVVLAWLDAGDLMSAPCLDGLSDRERAQVMGNVEALLAFAGDVRAAGLADGAIETEVTP